MPCHHCGATLTGAPTTCPSCGKALAAAPPAPLAKRTAAQSAQQAWAAMLALLRRVNAERTGLLAIPLVLVVCLAVNAALWWPLSFPPRWAGEAIGIFAPTGCSHHAFDTWKYDLCGVGLALYAMSGPILATVVLFLLRTPLASLSRRLMWKLPGETHFLWAPLVSTIAFTMVWASVPFHSFTRPGLVWDGFFPTLVAVATYLFVRYGPAVQRRVPGLLDLRDRLPYLARLALVIVIITAGAMLITRLLTPPPFFEPRWYEMYPPARDQLIALFALLCSYVLLAPRVVPAAPRRAAPEGVAA